jgi:hypothetical protein
MLLSAAPSAAAGSTRAPLMIAPYRLMLLAFASARSAHEPPPYSVIERFDAASDSRKRAARTLCQAERCPVLQRSILLRTKYVRQ